MHFVRLEFEVLDKMGELRVSSNRVSSNRVSHY